jgi:type I restriction enzyme S subunit
MSNLQADKTVPDVSADNTGLPEGWELTTIATAYELNPRKVPKDALPEDAPVTFVPMPAVDADSGTISAPDEKPFAKVRKGYTSFLEDDVIVAKITPCMENGKAAIARGLTNGHGFGSTEFHVLRPTGATIPDYVYHFVRQESFRNEAESRMRGAVGQKRVPPEFFEQVPFPLPPLAEQKRIVAKVESLLSRASAARARLARVPTLLQRFRQSVLAAACSGQLTADWREEHPELTDARSRLDEFLKQRRRDWEAEQLAKMKSGGKLPTNDKGKSKYRESFNPGSEGLDELPDGWCWAAVDQLASREPRSMQSGPFGSNLLHSEFQDTGILAIGIDNVLDGEFTLGKQHRISEQKYEDLKKYTARPHDVLITVMATVGRCCVVPADIETAIITKHVYRITVDRSLILPQYLMNSLRGAAEVVRQIQERVRGQTRPGINSQILKETAVPLPRSPNSKKSSAEWSRYSVWPPQ